MLAANFRQWRDKSRSSDYSTSANFTACFVSALTDTTSSTRRVLQDGEEGYKSLDVMFEAMGKTLKIGGK